MQVVHVPCVAHPNDDGEHTCMTAAAPSAMTARALTLMPCFYLCEPGDSGPCVKAA